MLKLFKPKCTFGDDETKDLEALKQEGELPVGEIIDFCGVKLEVVEETSCEGCFFCDKCFLQLDVFIGQCSSLSRFDRKSVIYKIVKKNDKSN